MENSYLNQERAISEVGKGYDILKQLQGLLHWKSRKAEEAVHMQELAEPLFREALQALNYALSIMKSGVSKVEMKQEITVIESSSPVHSSESGSSNYSNQGTDNGRGKRRRVEENSWTSNTSMPYDDGYQWRKYGDKKLSGTHFSRCYYRCTYKEEQGCPAKKLVEQTSDRDAPLFKVTYTNKHTCSFYKTLSTTSCPQPTPFGSIEKDSGINLMQHNMPQLWDQGSFLQVSPNDGIANRQCEWDIDSLLKDLVGFNEDDYLIN